MCPRHCRIVMVEKVLLIPFVMKFTMWTVVLSGACLNDVSSIPSQYDMWVRFLLSQYWSIRSLEILYAIDWARLEWTGTPRMYMLDNM